MYLFIVILDLTNCDWKYYEGLNDTSIGVDKQIRYNFYSKYISILIW